MRAGKDLQAIVKDGRPLENYPAISPLFALRTILDDIREQNKIQMHQGSVRSVSFSPDGKQLATAGSDGTARVWNLNGQQVAELKGHQGSVLSVSFSPDGKQLATAGSDGTARVWNLTGQQVAELKGHQGSVLSVSFSPDGKQLATAGIDGIVRLLPVENLDQLLARGCNWLHDYLQNPTVELSERDRHLCDGILTQK
jgi:WD40 repeat protein